MTETVTPVQPAPGLAASRATGLDITAFVFALFVPLVGAILGMAGIGEAHKAGRKAHGLSVAATVIGWLFTLIAVIVIVAVSVHSAQDPAQQFTNCVQNAIANNQPVSNCN